MESYRREAVHLLLTRALRVKKLESERVTVSLLNDLESGSLERLDINLRLLDKAGL